MINLIIGFLVEIATILIVISFIYLILRLFSYWLGHSEEEMREIFPELNFISPHNKMLEDELYHKTESEELDYDGEIGYKENNEA